jgi:hypothetical protein
MATLPRSGHRTGLSGAGRESWLEQEMTLSQRQGS